MGSSPGIANVFVKLCAEQLLDTVTSADIMHIHGGEPSEGAAVLKHRVHAMVNDVPLFADGRFVDVRMLEASGEAFVRTEDFPGLGPHPVFPYPHPETITLPATFPSLRRATNLGVVFPLSYFRRTQDLVRAAWAATSLCGWAAARSRRSTSWWRCSSATAPASSPRRASPAGPGASGWWSAAGRTAAEHTYVCTLSSSGAGAGGAPGSRPRSARLLPRSRRPVGRAGRPRARGVVPGRRVLSLATDVMARIGVGGPAATTDPARPGPTADRRAHRPRRRPRAGGRGWHDRPVAPAGAPVGAPDLTEAPPRPAPRRPSSPSTSAPGPEGRARRPRRADRRIGTPPHRTARRRRRLGGAGPRHLWGRGRGGRRARRPPPGQAGRVCAVAVTGQWGSTVPVDEAGDPVGECMLWKDHPGRRHVRRRSAAV